MALPALPAWAGIKLFLKSKKFIIGLIVIALIGAVGFGTYKFLNRQVDDKVELAVGKANDDATIQTYETQGQIDTRTIIIDAQMDRLREQTIRDYSNVQNQIQFAPADQKAAPVPPLIIDTLNSLDRLRNDREDKGGVPEPDVPAG